ncbi:hypothetical protein CR205_14480 [Alteribacter lacisalsi]|uniref:DUF4282 domain-containing protein n=1 Tax=Alteribacter lacisalsi TaxID=2045244 RepID=A0A2W0H9Z3_9BACI|nr:DUF4282 domain-containing protein [Alteribacter lacisalsi]PYZ96880.1 hypothetical protein CR205_14480 [Alteribacter lacisalsi]
MNEFFNFNQMITPTIIKILFWAGAGLSVLMGLITMFSGGYGFLAGLVIIAAGPLIVRVYCELLIVYFKVHESLNRVNNTLDRIAAKNKNEID